MSRATLLLCLLATAAVLPLGCAGPQPASLRALYYRAQVDLDCPGPYLQLQHLDSRSKLVVGCQRRLVYVQSCDDGPKRDCTWKVDSPVMANADWAAGRTTPPGAPAGPTHAGTYGEGPAPPGADGSAPPLATALFAPGEAPRPGQPGPAARTYPPGASRSIPIHTELTAPGTAPPTPPAWPDTRRPYPTELFDPLPPSRPSR
ncbi:MAG: hypothetical protein HY744_12690 [Deltaproteobacteria bacterium]|nr:hypothetical protein [Deltaproteobacteria bacterium]